MRFSNGDIQGMIANKQAELPEHDLKTINALLFATYPLYKDRASRQWVQTCLLSLWKSSPVCLSLFVSQFKEEATRSGLAPSNVLVLIEWGSLLMQTCSNEETAWVKYGEDILLADAQLLELVASLKARKSLLQAAKTVTWRGLRKVFRSGEERHNIVESCVSCLTAKSSSGPRNAVLLGLIAGVSARLSGLPSEKTKTDSSTNHASIAGFKKDYYAFWVREVISSKTVVPEHISTSFFEFFAHFSTLQEIEDELVPVLEKSLLRAPEVILNDVIGPIFQALPKENDLSNILATRLLKPLTSNLKSSNTNIREGAVKAFRLLLSRSNGDEGLDIVLGEILKPLASSKITSADQRALHAQILMAVSPSTKRSLDICSGITNIIAKEPNEIAMSLESQALIQHLSFLILETSENIDPFTSTLEKGLSEKKLPIQKTWSLRVGQLLWSFKSTVCGPSSTAICESILPKLLSISGEAVANPISASQSGQVIAAYILTSVYDFLKSLNSPKLESSLVKAKTLESALTVSPRPSFLLNHKVYTKIVGDEELIWFARALAACTPHLQDRSSPSEVTATWSQAWVYLHGGSNVSHRVRKTVHTLLKQEYLRRPATISKILISGLWICYKDIELGTKESPCMALQAGTASLHNVIHSIVVPQEKNKRTKDMTIPKQVLQEQLLDSLVLFRPEIIPRTDWINMCLELGQDPGDLVANDPQLALDKVNQILASNTTSSHQIGTIMAACWNTFADLAFVSPNTIVPKLTAQVIQDLDLTELQKYGPTDFAIARTAEGTTFVDVLSAKRANEVPDKAHSDYELFKWEAEIRAEQAARKGQQKKLTHDEQSKVQAQLAKEAIIREKVNALQQKLRRGINTIAALALGPPTDSEQWLGPMLKALIDAIQAGAGLLVGNIANDAFIACANLANARLGSLRQFVGIATLRALGSTHIPEYLLQESLGTLVTRVLYRLRIAGEQRPFDAVSLSYILPLVQIVLRQRGVGCNEQDAAEEQVTLAIEFLGLHSNVFSNAKLPRANIISGLIRAMQDYNQHYRELKDTLIDVCRSIADNASPADVQSLLQGIIVPESNVRTAVLQGILDHIDLTDLDFCAEIWLASHDDAEENAELGQAIWQENALGAEGKDAFKLLPYLQSKDKQLRRAAARSIAACVALDGSVFETLLADLQEEYREKAKSRVPERDVYGMLKKTDLSDPWEARDGVGLVIGELASIWPTTSLILGVEFLMQDKALGDQNPNTRDTMISSATKLISLQGDKKLEELMAMFEKYLSGAESSGSGADLVNEAVVILYGALAKHLKPGDERISKVVIKLLDTLSTPSETVQFAVSGCLPALVRTSLDQISDYVQRVLHELLQSPKYATRRGAAYGLAGIVSGRGIGALKEYRIMFTLKSAADNKKDVNARQGALFAFELFALLLGRMFEPYVIEIVDILISSFGDTSADVREASLDTSKTCFSILSSYGVKEILPKLLDGLDESQWRSKRGACDLLGSMAYLDPQQLASSLPEIIPPLTNVLNDSHKEVRAAANRSLQRFGEVISNPEVKSLVNILLKALSDPTKYTDDALDALIKVSFIHYLDAPSLALIVRILGRGLGDRSGTKRKSAQIIGSLAHLTERKDLISHLPILVAGLRTAAVDPVPTTRATASKALGSLMEKLGEDALPDLIPSLMATLKSDTGAGDRLGSAQALSEVLAGLGTSRLEETLPTILQNVSSSRPAVREGFMSLFIFLPACFGNSFANYLNRVIPPILAGLADEVESIRETSLRAGRLLVKNFATKSIDLLLPELDRGLADDNYRIRLSSVELVGDLLFNLTGISGTTEQEDEDSNAVEAGQSLLEVLGEEKRNKILSSLYICRCDTSGLVRTAAINVWKALVATPKTLKELVPTLTQSIIKRLASSNMEQKVIAGNALGELIRKAGEGVLSILLPTLEEGLQTSSDIDNRQGICIALREIISSSSSESLEDYEKTLFSVVRVALVDSDAEVRETAAEAFDSLQDIFGKKVVDQVMPHLLNLLRSEEEADTALSALLTLLTDNSRANIILPNLVPTLLKAPISAFNARAIASLAKVAGPSISRRLPTILNALEDAIIATRDEELKTELESSFDSILLSADEFDGLNTIMSVMLALVKHVDHRRRANAAMRFAMFIDRAEVDFSRYYPDVIRVLLLSFGDSDVDVVKAAWTALAELMKRLKKEEMESLVISTRQIVQQVGVAGHDLPGFCLPKGIDAILPIFLQGLVNGSAEQRTQAALAISDIADRTSADALKPYVTKITGPLIRVVSERSVELKGMHSCAFYFY